MKFKLITGRTLGQGRGKEIGKFSKEYFESVSICEIDPDDMKKLGVEDSSKVVLSNSNGSIVLKAVKSRQAPHRGIVFVPYGPWANQLTDSWTHGSGMPSYKGVEVEVQSTKDADITSLETILEKL